MLEFVQQKDRLLNPTLGKWSRGNEPFLLVCRMMKWSWEKVRQRRWDSNPQQSKLKCMRVRNLLTAPLTLPGKVDFSTTTTPPLTTLLPACISWFIGSPRQWRIIMKQAVFGKCLGMLCGDVWQNDSVRSWKWECHNHGRGVSSTGRWGHWVRAGSYLHQ